MDSPARRFRFWTVSVFVTCFGMIGCSSPNSTVTLSPTPIREPVVLTGTIRETGTHEGIAGANVCWAGRCAVSAPDGSFRLDTQTIVEIGHSQCTVVVFKEGFESRNECLQAGLSGVSQYDPALQRQIVITAGESVSTTLYWDDAGGFILEDFCQTCKRIHVRIPGDGQLVATLAAEDPSAAQLELIPATPLRASAGSMVIFTISSRSQQAFRLSTQLIPD
jgi:hypothetical protein